VLLVSASFMNKGNTLATESPEVNFSGQSNAIFENIFDFFGTLDADGFVLDLQGRIFEKTNTNPTLLVGQQFSQTVFWQSSENTSKIFEKAVESAVAGEPSKLILDFRIGAGEKIAVEVYVQPLKVPSGEVQVFVCGQSVSDRKSQVEHNEPASEQLLFAAENAEIGLWFWDYREDRIYSTPRFNELFELPAYETLRYEKLRNTIHPDDRDFVDEFLRRSRLEGTKYEEEFRLLYSDGTIEWICAEGKSFLDDDGQPQRMMGVIQKITEQKIADEELARVYEREKRARDEAVEANRAKDFFLAFVSHELRSPLNAILGWSKILLSKNVDEETRKSALETIERSARFQTKLINDLVDSARVASGKLRLEYRPTNLFEIVRNSFHAQKPSAEARHITFELRSDTENIPLFGDSNRLQQVFGNLISNAIKFTPEGGSVAIDIETTENTVTVHVSDTGHGIDPAALPNIFRQFSQGDVDQGKSNAGLGLGLSIVKILVAKHGGAVKAESEGVNKGSRFTVTLPLSAGEQAVSGELAPPPDITNRKLLQGARIFIVEDDDDSREVLQLFIKQNGAVVTSFQSAKAALAGITKPGVRLPDVLISDLGMPDEDGFSLIRKIRALPPESGGTVPTLALSAFTSNESKQKAFESGFDKYCTKPYEPDLLIKDILELLKRSAGTTAA
jgi:PAS domain S-box-containing protein